MKLPSLLLLLLLPGCAYQVSKLYDPGSGKLAAKSRTVTFFDSSSSLAKLHIDTMSATNKNGVWSPGISISGLDQTSSSTGAVQIIKIVVETAAPAVKALVP